MSTSNRIFDDLGRVLNDAAGVADGVRREVETAIKSQAERFVNDMDLVKREDFDVLRELVQAQGEEIAALRAELAALRPAEAPAADAPAPAADAPAQGATVPEAETPAGTA